LYSYVHFFPVGLKGFFNSGWTSAVIEPILHGPDLDLQVQRAVQKRFLPLQGHLFALWHVDLHWQYCNTPFKNDRHTCLSVKYQGFILIVFRVCIAALVRLSLFHVVPACVCKCIRHHPAAYVNTSKRNLFIIVINCLRNVIHILNGFDCCIVPLNYYLLSFTHYLYRGRFTK